MNTEGSVLNHTGDIDGHREHKKACLVHPRTFPCTHWVDLCLGCRDAFNIQLAAASLFDQRATGGGFAVHPVQWSV